MCVHIPYMYGYTCQLNLFFKESRVYEAAEIFMFTIGFSIYANLEWVFSVTYLPYMIYPWNAQSYLKMNYPCSNRMVEV